MRLGHACFYLGDFGQRYRLFMSLLRTQKIHIYFYVLYPTTGRLLKIGTSIEPLKRWRIIWGSRGRWCPERSICWRCKDAYQLEAKVKRHLKEKGSHRPLIYTLENGWTEWFTKESCARISTLVAEYDPEAVSWLPTIDHFLKYSIASERHLPFAKRSAHFWGRESRFRSFLG